MPRSPHLQAKVCRPRLAQLLARERLFSRLDELCAAPVIWICGPPGAGKTSLAASYLDSRHLPALWYQVDAGDGDLGTFFSYLARAAEALAPNDQAPLPRLTPEYFADIPGFARRFFRQLFERLPRPAQMVLDNFHEASDLPAFAAVVREAVPQVPPGVNLIIVSRNEPGESFARFRGSRSLEVLGWEELRLTQAEARSIATGATGLDETRLGEVLQRAHGWPAGLMLLIEALNRGGLRAEQPPGSLPEQAVFDYFASELLAAVPAPMRDMLVRLAHLTRFSAQAAQTASGNADANSMLDWLYERRLFVERRAQPPVYDFHPLLREFLLSRAHGRLPLSELPLHLTQAAHLAEQDGEIEAAARLYAEAADWVELSRLVTEQAPDLLREGRYHTLSAIIDRIPAALIDRQPWMLYWQGMAHIHFGPAEARALLERAYALFRQGDHWAGSFLASSCALRNYFYEWSDLRGIDRWLAELADLAVRQPDYVSAEVEAQVLAAGFPALYRHPSHPLLRDWAQRAARLIHMQPVESMRSGMGEFLLAYHLFRGDFAQCEEVLRIARAALDPRKTPPMLLIGLEAFTGMHAFLSVGNADACPHLDKALALCNEHGIHVLDAWLNGERTFTLLSAGMLDEAEASLREMEVRLQVGRRIDFAFFHHLRASLRLLQGLPERAREEAKSGIAICEQAGTPVFEAMNRITLACALIALREYTAAADELSRLHSAAESSSSTHFLFTTCVAEAYLALEQSEYLEAVEKLRAALALGREREYLNTPPLWMPTVMSRLCDLALEQGIETEYVTRIIRIRRIAPPEDAANVWPWPVKVFTLGRFGLLIDGRAPEPSSKAQKRSLDLLKAIVALGGREVDVAALADVLWPESEGHTARSAFDMALHRLRKLLRYDEAVLLHEGKVTLNPHLCWVDAWALERRLGGLEGSLERQSSDERSDHNCREVLQLYQGSFLNHDGDKPWILPTRERLRRRLLRVIGALGRRWEAGKHWDQAVALYERALEQDPLAEELYRRLITCHLQRDAKADGISAYRRYREMRSVLLGMPPSRDMEALHERLNRAEVTGQGPRVD